jgi:hypothetical protein
MTLSPSSAWIAPPAWRSARRRVLRASCRATQQKREWQHTQDYCGEREEFRAIDLDDAAFRYATQSHDLPRFAVETPSLRG